MALDDAMREGLKAAAERLAAAMRTIAAVKTKEGARAVNIAWEGDEVIVQPGSDRGVYGWEPIQAAMFEGNDRHPLFGNKNHWYAQGRWPITEMTERAALDDAVERFADKAIPGLLDDVGLGDDRH